MKKNNRKDYLNPQDVKKPQNLPSPPPKEEITTEEYLHMRSLGLKYGDPNLFDVDMDFY